MGDKVQRKIVQFLHDEKHKKKLAKIVGLLVVAVVICTTYALILPAVTATDETYCGVEDHEHTLSCYSNPDADTETQEDWEKTLPAADELTGQWTQDVVSIAKSQIGYAESTDNYTVENETDIYGYTRYGQWYGTPYEKEWSTVFALFCLNYAGVSDQVIPYSADCTEWADALDAKNLLTTSGEYEPQAGDIILFDTDDDAKADHAGIVAGINDDNNLVVIEGNSNDKVEQNEYKTDNATIYGYVKLPEQKVEDAETENTTGEEATEETENTTGETVTDETESTTGEAETNEIESTTGEAATDEAESETREAETDKTGTEATAVIPEVPEVSTGTTATKKSRAKAAAKAASTTTSTTTVNVNKVWNDSATHTSDSVTVILYKDGEEYDTHVLNRSNSWKYSWTNLPDDGTYTVAEDLSGASVKKYTPTVTGGKSADSSVKWEMADSIEDGETYAIGYYDSSSNLKLLTAAGAGSYLSTASNSESYDSGTYYLQSTVGNGSQWIATKSASDAMTLKNVNNGVTQYMYLGYSAGTRFYSTSSTGGSAYNTVYFDKYYSSTYGGYYFGLSIYDGGYYYFYGSTSTHASQSNATGCWFFKKVYVSPTYDYTITNTPTIEVGDSVTSVKVKKSWADGNNQEVVVHLLDEEGNRLDTEYGVKKLNSSNGFQAKWDDLPEAVYTVEEDAIDGYTATTSCTRSANTIYARINFSDFDGVGTYLIGSKSGSSYKLWNMGSTGTQITTVSTSGASSSITLGGQTYTDYIKAANVNENEKLVFSPSTQYSGYYFVRDAITKSKRLYGGKSTNTYVSSSTSNDLIRFVSSRYIQTWYSDGYVYDYRTYLATSSSSSSATQYYLFKEITDTTYDYTITNSKTKVSDIASYEEYEKTIDALRSGTGSTNTDTTLASDTDLTDLYRLYLNVGPMDTKKGVDLLIVVDQSSSMGDYSAEYNRTSMKRDAVVTSILNGDVDSSGNAVSTDDGLINEFLALNNNNRYAVIKFSGDASTSSGANDSGVKVDWTSQYQAVTVTADKFTVPGATEKASGTNYAAAYKLANTMFNELKTKYPNDTNEKVMLFISDGVPTFSFSSSGTRLGDGTTVFSNDAFCVQPTMDSFATDFTDNQPDVTVHTVGLLSETDGNCSAGVLRYMARVGNGDFINAADGDTLASALEQDILGGGRYTDVVVKDELSDYVDMYTTQPDYKLTMTTDGKTVTLWEGNAATSAGEGIIESVTYDEKTKTVTAKFYPSYKLEIKSQYVLSFNVKTTETAYNTAATNLQAGKDKYGGTVGDEDTDYGDNNTSSKQGGFRSNKEAVATYMQGGKEGQAIYDHPVVQTATCKLTIKKVSQDNPLLLLEGAEFDLYRAAYTGETNTVTGGSGGTVKLLPSGSYVKVNSASITTGTLGTATVSNLEPGDYYLIETKAPDGYTLPTEVLQFNLTRTAVTVATQTGKESLIEGSSQSAVLTVKNDSGMELPQTGGQGTTWYIVSGAFLIMCSLIIYIKFCKGQKEEKN